MLMDNVMLPAVADALIDAALVLGGEATLKILYMKLVEVNIVLFDNVKLPLIFPKDCFNCLPNL